MKPKEIIIGLAIALVVAVFVSPFASPFLDGLEKVAEEKGFLWKGEDAVVSSPVPDYAWPGVSNEKAATALAGTAGVLITFFVVWGAAFLARHRQP